MEKTKKVNEWQTEKRQRLMVLLLTMLMLAGSLGIFYQTMTEIKNRPQVLWLIVMALLGVAGCELARYLRKRKSIFQLVILVPWVAAFAVSGFSGYSDGMKAWINGMIHRWNQIHEGGAALFSGNMTAEDLQAFCLVLAVLMGQVIWFLMTEGHTILVWCWGIVWVVLMIVCDVFSASLCSLVFCGLVGMYIAGKKLQMNKVAVCWFFSLVVICLAGTLLIPDKHMLSVERMRSQAKEKIHEIRYGEEKLPAGDLSQAAQFQKNQQKMITVTSAQEKNLYLKAFTGGVYRDGIWEEMPASEYGGEDAGMLRWVKGKNFDPLTQVAEYYRLGKKKQVTSNKVKIEVSGASRDYFYSTGTLKKVSDGKVKEKEDYGLLTTGLLGERNYTFSELSGNKPAELTVADAWVQNPKTKAQKEYCEAEAVYRDFVYRHYTTVDKKMYQKVQEIFWKDYNSDSDGIYSALNQIRTVLKNDYTYTTTPPAGENEDVLTGFLEESREGNSMLYASAAVEAFRAHGIPARYVEGYYIPSTAIASSEDGHVMLSGEDMHAWAEVYFDGIGWLPVDVTPGYYYDVAALQNMVNTPEQIQKNAALKDNSFGGKQSSDANGNGKKLRNQLKKQAWNVLAVIMGIIAIVILCITIGIVVLEAGEMVQMYRLRNGYRRARGKERILIIEQEIFLILHCMGIEASLGWKTKETDRLIKGKFRRIHTGSYIRVCELLEKQIYGDITLEPFEEHALESFLAKLLEESRVCDWKTKWKIHQRHFGFAIMKG